MTVSPALRAEFAPTGTLRVALNMRNFLLTRTDPATGLPAGVAPELGHELGRRLGLPVVMCPYTNPGDAADGARKGEWDVCFLAAEAERAADIDFTPAYVEIDATYLVPAPSPLQRAAEVDAPGVRIVAPDRAAFELYLTRTLKHATLERAAGADGAFRRFVDGGLDALAGLRPQLTADQRHLPGSRVLDDRFTAVQQAAGVPKGRPDAAASLRAFIADVVASGFVAEAIRGNGVVGLTLVGSATS